MRNSERRTRLGNRYSVLATVFTIFLAKFVLQRIAALWLHPHFDEARKFLPRRKMLDCSSFSHHVFHVALLHYILALLLSFKIRAEEYPRQRDEQAGAGFVLWIVGKHWISKIA